MKAIYKTGKIKLFSIFHIILCALLFITPTFLFSQVINLGFENGNFSGWQGATGQCCPVFTPLPGLNTLQYEITSGTNTDPYSNGLIPIVAPGSLFSAKLGNNGGAAESERLMTSFLCQNDSQLLIIRYATVLENAHHPEPKQPRFGYSISINGAVASSCFSKTVISGDSTIGFISTGNYDILPWQADVIDLRGHAGDSISITLETGDCEPGGHFGYAYVDCGLINAELNGNFCNTDGSTTLYAPQNIPHQWFDGSSTDSIFIQNPIYGVNYVLTLNPNTPCEIYIEKNIDAFLPQSLFNSISHCDKSFNFIHQSILQPGSNFTWDFGDGNSSIIENPYHSYLQNGSYQVALTIQQADNCKSNHTQIINVDNVPEASFTAQPKCAGELISIENNSSPCSQNFCSYEWLLDGVSEFNVALPSIVFNNPGVHNLKLIVTDGSGCTDTSESTITILPYPLCDEELTNIYIPNAFTPNGDGINDYFEINENGEYAITFYIYNRFGEIIYSGKKWNGKLNDKACPEGIYEFTIENNNHSFSDKRGSLLLLR